MKAELFLFLNSLGTGEVLVVLLFILMFFGAKNIPGIARTMGRGIRQMKNASQEIQNEITKSTNDMRSDLNIKREIEQTVRDMDKPKPKATPSQKPQDLPETKSTET